MPTKLVSSVDHESTVFSSDLLKTNLANPWSGVSLVLGVGFNESRPWLGETITAALAFYCIIYSCADCAGIDQVVSHLVEDIEVRNENCLFANR